MDDLFNGLNLQEATDAVKRNKGAAGIDGRSIAETPAHLDVHWPAIEAYKIYMPSEFSVA